MVAKAQAKELGNLARAQAQDHRAKDWPHGWRRALALRRGTLCGKLYTGGPGPEGGHQVSLRVVQANRHSPWKRQLASGQDQQCGSREDSELQLEKISGGGSSKDRTNSEDPGVPLVPAGSVSKGPAGIGRQGLQTGLCHTGLSEKEMLQTGLCEKRHSEKQKMRKQSFYPLCNKDVARSVTKGSHLSKAKDKAVVTSTTMDSKLLKALRKILNGDKCCHNSFGMLEDCAEEEGSDEVLTSKKFEVATSEKFEVLSSEKLEPATLKKSYKQVVAGDSSEVFHRVESNKEKKEARKVSSLGSRMPEGLKSMEEAPEWDVLEMAMDSGASESVVNDEMLPRVETLEGEAMKKGVQYEVADGTLIPNLGEKKFIAVSDNGVARQTRAQVCDVNKALLSVHRVVQAGNRVVFASSGSYVEDETAGETMELVEKGGMYMLKLWVKAQGFRGLNEA